ncbi:MAG: MAPEG family protein [Rhodanobacteraceae bacterium]
MTGFTAVLLYALWTLLLPIFYAGYRVPMIFGGRRRADHWERGKPVDDPPLLARAKSAHLNCTENFPIFAAVVCIGALLGKTATIDALAGFVLYARILQSLSHIAGTSTVLVLLRGTFYAVQIVLIITMIGSLLR